MKALDFAVEGKGPFPMDMLRYDACHPADPDSAMALYSDRREQRKVKLRSYVVRQPTAGRWSSFGWSVVRD